MSHVRLVSRGATLPEKACWQDWCFVVDRSSCPRSDTCTYDYAAHCPSVDTCWTDTY
jgi:hypothetical protein